MELKVHERGWRGSSQPTLHAGIHYMELKGTSGGLGEEAGSEERESITWS